MIADNLPSLLALWDWDAPRSMFLDVTDRSCANDHGFLSTPKAIFC